MLDSKLSSAIEIARCFALPEKGVEAAIELFAAGATLPFVARYRQDKTAGLNETQLRQIQELQEKIAEREERREYILNSLLQRELLSAELKNKLCAAKSLAELEDIYLPYKQSRKTRAEEARKKGLGSAAGKVRRQIPQPAGFFTSLISAEQGLLSEDDVKSGISDIIAEEIAADTVVRSRLRQILQTRVFIATTKGKTEDPRGLYRDYYEFSQRSDRIPAYRVMALERGEKEKFLKVDVQTEFVPFDDIARIMRFRPEAAFADLLDFALKDAWKRLLWPTLQREIRSSLKEQAHERSLQIFSRNLRALLLSPPLEKNLVILGMDPGFRAGNKCAVLSAHGDYLDAVTIYPLPPQNRVQESADILQDLLQKHAIGLIAIGNGTGSYETGEFVMECLRNWKRTDIFCVKVNEAGASVYSASECAVQEFPKLDVTIRGAISIARRAQDMLAELVKIPPEAIGVGMYQHDLPSKRLKQVLGREVESVVNLVGVDLNTASAHLLAHVSGLNKKTAAAIVEERKRIGAFKSRRELLKISGLGVKAFELCAGFCRLPEAENPLENTTVHPESYDLATEILHKTGLQLSDLRQQKEKVRQTLSQANTEQLALEMQADRFTVSSVLQSLAAPVPDPRKTGDNQLQQTQLYDIKDLKPGQKIKGIIRNVTDFGAFIDIGVKTEGLLHRSALKKGWEIHQLSPGEIMEIEILSVDSERGRISLAQVL